ncbi:MAG TPA: hypothetical protein VFB12_08340 [Ktedonobacteraceae bacterium]|nr:hypothetical protein [Ktedonobacteraceae bacterium]
MHKIFLDLLECPGCHGSLTWKWLEVHGERIEEAEGHCTGCGTNYPVREGIGIKTMTTLLGLSNIENPGLLLHELRRIISGSLLAIVHFFPEDDEANAAAIRATSDPSFHFQHSALEQFVAAGWQVELANVCKGQARPTPSSSLLPGLQIDGLPVAETVLEWVLLAAH